MPSDGSGRKSVFEKIREHHGRMVDKESRKFRWRFTTLRNDFTELKEIHQLELPRATERGEQLETQGYVFEVERKLFHYLSGLYTLIEQQKALQNGIGDSFRGELGEVRGEYLGSETARTIMGLRHFVQHENVLPLQVRTSKLDQSSSLVLLVDDLHRQGEDRDFESHFGHIDGAYFDPLEWIEKDWPNVETFFSDSIEVIEEQTKEEREELNKLNKEVDALYDRVSQDLRELREKK
ncbi:hypothetical protein [Halogeometricum borinquense]|uniref:hypothetical protein n=1 Tax=Halogeometricum borinquense TaxID=60847 RepID=UPI00342946E6